jgi:sugar phosphate permease
LPETFVRYRVVAITTAMSVLLYLDRNCIAVIAPKMSKELGLNDEQMALVFSAFFASYALSQVPAGWLGDRLGGRVMLTACVLAWSLCTGLMGLAWGLTALVAVRLLFGIAQAGAYPVTARIYSLWVPFHRRALANSLVTLGGRSGSVIAPALTVFLMAKLDGWRPVFGIYALAGIAWSAYFWVNFRNRPATHPECSPAEVEFIEQSRPAQATSPHGRADTVPFADMLRSRSLWLQSLTQMSSNMAWLFFTSWMPTYLIRVHGVSEEDAGYLTSLPALAGTVGCLLGGLATDYLTRRIGLRWGRSALGMASKLLAGGSMLLAALAPNPVLATLAFALANFTTDLGLGATWAYFQDAGGAYVGTLLGWANMFGNLGAAVSPLLLAYLAHQFEWPTTLAICGGFFIFGGLCWLGVDARVPIVTRRDEGTERDQ